MKYLRTEWDIEPAVLLDEVRFKVWEVTVEETKFFKREKKSYRYLESFKTREDAKTAIEDRKHYRAMQRVNAEKAWARYYAEYSETVR